jgi:protein-S-isoprenylcysteine O-methyltransferase Ste14
MLKWVDMPPVWLAGAIALVWALDRVLPFGVFGVLGVFGQALIWAGLGLMGLAAGQMVLARTTVIPKSRPAALVTGGVFRICRNPIYLADAMVLAGLILHWDVPLALPVLPLFVWLITERFIKGEEAMLRAGFGTAFDDWAARVGRWLPKV